MKIYKDCSECIHKNVCERKSDITNLITRVMAIEGTNEDIPNYDHMILHAFCDEFEKAKVEIEKLCNIPLNIPPCIPCSL